MGNISPIAKAIKSEMERKDWSVPALSTASGVQISAIYRFLRGETDPQLETVQTLLNAVGLRITLSRGK